MGLFSRDCNICKRSIRSGYSTNSRSSWMTQAVVVYPSETYIEGEYDGYGRIIVIAPDHGETIDVSQADASFYHRACWKNAFEPSYTGNSEYSDDQGYFVDSNPGKPRKKKEKRNDEVSRAD